MKCLIVLIVYVALLSIVGTIDRNDQLAGEKQYCEKVAAGEWPDYKKKFKEFCKKELQVSQD